MNPLDQLADITTPEAVSMWPLAWGYWLAIAILVAVLVWGVSSLRRYRLRRKVKLAALKALGDISDNSNYAEIAHKVQVIIKNICAHYLPESNSKMLYGDSWHTFLLALYKGGQKTEFASAIDVLQARLYAPSALHLGNNTCENENHANNSNEIEKQNILILKAMKDFVQNSFPCSQNKRLEAQSELDISPQSRGAKHV